MNRQAKSLLLSLLIHGVAICVIIAMSSSFARTSKTVLIDLTLLKPESSEGPAHEVADVKTSSRGTPPNKQETGTEKASTVEASKASRHSYPLRTPKPAHISKHVPLPASPGKAARKHERSAGGGGGGGHSPGPVPSIETSKSSGTGSGIGTGTGSGRGSGTGSGTGTGTGSGMGSGTGSGTGNAQTASVGGPGQSVEHMRNRYLKEQFEYIKKMIEKNLVYPDKARRMGWSGIVVVSFIILENGHVSNEKIVRSSGYEVLDNNVIATIKRIEPFPKPPVSAELKIPITYRLEE
jgi:protein TonB